MKLSLLKPILAAAGTALMLTFTLALKPSQAQAESLLTHKQEPSATSNHVPCELNPTQNLTAPYSG